MATALLAGGAAVGLAGTGEARLLLLATAVAALSVLGFVDDVRPLPWRPKLAAQAVAAALAIASLPAEAALAPTGWFWAERAVATLALMGFVNIVNFIDGIDEITLAHAVPAFAVMTAVAVLLPLDGPAGPLAAAGLGAMLGFWPWNRHPAKIFLGDAGSLPLGLCLGWLALALAYAGEPVAALLILLYPLADGTITLARRFRAGRTLTEPHRDHAYQRAVDSGIAAPAVALSVGIASLACAGLALLSIGVQSAGAATAMLALGAAIVLAPIIVWLRAPGGRP